MKRVIISFLTCIDIAIVIFFIVLLKTSLPMEIMARIYPYPSLPMPKTAVKMMLVPVSSAPAVNATAAYLLDTNSMHILFAKDANAQLPMASTSKIMTAIIALEKTKPSSLVTVKEDAITEVQANGGSSADLVAGDIIPMDDLLYGLLLPSGDDAAIAIADSISGSPTNFAVLMNQYAKKLGLTHTHYINPDGLTYQLSNGKLSYNYTSAADLADLMQYAMRNPAFAEIVNRQVFTLSAGNGHHAYTWNTTDDLLAEYPGATGGKTGFTSEAGYCLVFTAERNGHHLIGVLLNDSTTDISERFLEAEKLLNWGFSLPEKSIF